MDLVVFKCSQCGVDVVDDKVMLQIPRICEECYQDIEAIMAEEDYFIIEDDGMRCPDCGEVGIICEECYECECSCICDRE